MLSPGANWFIAKGFALMTSFYIVTLVGSFLFTQAVDWRAWQDPRKRLLWDGVDPTATIAIIGDSAFLSGYVNTEDQSLWKVLERVTGRHVFNGTLDGAEPADFIKAAQLLAQYDGTGKIVLLDIIPDRFLQNRAPPQESGNYPTEFGRRVGENITSRLLVTLVKPVKVLDPDILMNVVKRKRFFGTKEYRDVVWSSDGSGRARAKFQSFEEYWLDTGGLNSFRWIEGIECILQQRGYRLIVVLTPVNRVLLNEYARLREPKAYEKRLDAAHETLLSYLDEKGVPYIDAYTQFESEEFADLIHFNASGDRHMAELIAAYLAKPRGLDRSLALDRAAQHGAGAGHFVAAR